MQIHIKCIKPFKNWDKHIPCNIKPQDICGIMRDFAQNFPECNITLECNEATIAYAKWSTKRGVHDLGCTVGLERL